MHKCRVLVFTCLDWRQWPRLSEELKKKYGSFDLVSTAGAVAGFLAKETRKYLLKQVELSKELHRIEIVVLAMHRDCGAFGGTKAHGSLEAETKHHKKKMNQVRKIMNSKFPGLQIETFVFRAIARKR